MLILAALPPVNKDDSKRALSEKESSEGRSC